MFGYVTPCKMELKLKDYEKFKAYYCGLCKAIKINYGSLPRLTLNYDMTFTAILLSSLKYDEDTSGVKFVKGTCIIHPIKKRLFVADCNSLDYAAFLNVTLAYFKLLDNFSDDRNIFSKVLSIFLKGYMSKTKEPLKVNIQIINNKLSELSKKENSPRDLSLDELAHPFAELTSILFTAYRSGSSFEKELGDLGYNLGKWIYIIDALDDLRKDMKDNKFNAINAVYNLNSLPYESLYEMIKDRIAFLLSSYGEQTFTLLKKLPLKSNQALLENILQYGLMEKIDKVFMRSEFKHEKSLWSIRY